jgi:hypothetical protein
VIPTHKNILTTEEIQRILKNREMNPFIIFVTPEKNFSSFNSKYGNLGEVEAFPNNFFASRESYNHMLLSVSFWKRFSEYEKIIICQTDALLIKKTEPLNNYSYSFIGSPWRVPRKFRIVSGEVFINHRRQFFYPYTSLSIGNGGLSFRNTSHHLQVLQNLQLAGLAPSLLSGRTNEDLVFSYLFKLLGFPMPSAELAGSIFIEETSSGLMHIPDVFGFHALTRFNPHLEKLILGLI